MNEQNMLKTGLTDSREVLPGIYYMRTAIVNVVFIENRSTGSWVLVDTGIASFDDEIREFAEKKFGTAPNCIILTHGHFDHVGNVKKLADHWNVPVYAHVMEHPFLTGGMDYPPGDPSVGGGLMAQFAPVYPNKAIDLGTRLFPLPEDQSVPGLPEWHYIHTPGHSLGHVSLFHKQDGILVAGDAFITVKQESALAVVKQEKEIHGPPTYFTPDWVAARESVKRLAALRPKVAVTGHGVPVSGVELADQLEQLARNFDELAVPEKGRYVDDYEVRSRE